MKAKHKKRTLQLDLIKQKQNETSDKKYQNRKHTHNSGGSSDFSQFQLQSKDINNDFVPFQKPKRWKKQSSKFDLQNRKIKKRKQNKQIKQLEQIHPNGKKQQQANRQTQQIKQTSKQNLEKLDQKTVSHLISFAKSPSNPKLSTQYQKRETKRLNKQDEANDQSLITQYDKAQFNNKSPQQKAQQNFKNLQRSRKNEQQKQLKQNKMIQSYGGICFQVDKADFVFDQDPKKRKTKKKSRKAKRKEDINSNLQLLKRRQRAFKYGQFIRRRNFGYY